MLDGPSPHEEALLDVPADSTEFIATGLRAATTYRFAIAAVSAAGVRGQWSEWEDETTGRVESAPDPPEAPLPRAQSTCDSIRLRLPALRVGCSADASLDLEVSPAGPTPHWSVARRSLEGSEEVIVEAGTSGVTTRSAFVFRLRATNSRGESAPGPQSASLVTGGYADEMRAAPVVQAQSSASYLIEWGGVLRVCASHGVLWSVQYRRTSTTRWDALVSLTNESRLVVELRCPEGCSFRVLPSNIKGWPEPSAASEPLPTLKLYPPAHGAVRTQFSLFAANSPIELAAARVGRDVSAALGVAEGRVRCVELRPPATGTADEEKEDGGLSRRTMVVLDLLPASHAMLAVPGDSAHGGLWTQPEAAALELARRLAVLLASREAPAGTVLSRADFAAGLQRLHESGRCQRVSTTPWPLSSFSFQLALTLVLGCCFLFALRRVLARCPQRHAKAFESAAAGHEEQQPIKQPQEDEDEEDDHESIVAGMPPPLNPKIYACSGRALPPDEPGRAAAYDWHDAPESFLSDAGPALPVRAASSPVVLASADGCEQPEEVGSEEARCVRLVTL